MTERFYSALPTYSSVQAIKIAKPCDDTEDCLLLPLSVGEYWDN